VEEDIKSDVSDDKSNIEENNGIDKEEESSTKVDE